ncbi:metallophosphoesterase [Yoonia sp. I 8.24]|uniref:metallophosphoesterase family protein n=1 Tax=Yoonia sp. I 8.24 TaxID=1537229 RepID=UPI001EDF1629|nr:metallophosphoesterase [Yoonia sp. I 8.24]MCG3269578.1 metallophosphoesterase family protein [Yoonia sp. I 8.24]
MKIFACSDLHRDVAVTRQLLSAGASADVIVVAGDFATRGIGAEDTLEVLAESAVPVIVVHGNHDVPSEIESLCARSEALHYLHGTKLVIGGETFFGLGGEIPSRNSFDWNASETEEHAGELLRACPVNALVVTHTPPFGIADLQKNGAHEGSTAILDMFRVKAPKLVLCGHIHHAWGMSGHQGATHVHNLGPTENWFEV